MRKVIAIISIISVSFMLSGYGIGYSTKQFNYKSIKQIHINIVILKFEDNRPEEELLYKYRKKKNPENYSKYTADNYLFYEDMMSVVTWKMVRHFRVAKLFDKVDYIKNISIEDIESGNIPKKLKKKYDAILIGKINHMYGYSTLGINEKQAGMYYGFPGKVLHDMLVKDKRFDYRAEMELSELKLISTIDGKILWSGKVKRKIEKDNLKMDNSLIHIEAVREVMAETVDTLIRNISNAGIEVLLDEQGTDE